MGSLFAGVLLLLSCTVCAASERNPLRIDHELARLQQELQDAKDTLSQVLGAEPVTQGPHLQGFIPGTANTQRLVARQPDLWTRHFTFLSAVAADSSVTCSHVMMDRAGNAGAPLYLVVADAVGRLYFFTPGSGHLLYEHDTGVSSSITALSSDLVRHNQTHLLVGQADGTITMLTVQHEHPRLPDGSGIRAVHPTMMSTAADRAQQCNDSDISSHQQPIRHLLFGTSSSRRMMVAADESGRVLLMIASSGHILMTKHVAAGPPLAITLNNNFQLVVQTDTSTALLLLKRGRSLVTRSCTGLGPTPAGPQAGVQVLAGAQEAGDQDRLVAAVFDPQRSFRAFGVTSRGDLVSLVVPSGVAAHHCRVAQRVPLGLPPGPVHLVLSQGRLVLLHSAGIAAFDLSARKAMLPGNYLVSHTWQHLWRLYGLLQQYQQLSQPGSDDTAPGSEAGHVGSDVRTSGTDASSVSSSSRDDGLQGLQSCAWGSSLMAASATTGLLLMPFGSKGLAAFTIGQSTGFAAGGVGGAAAGGSNALSSGGSGGTGAEVNWVKVLQPFVVIMMIIVGVWQFVRASSRSNLSGMRSARYQGGDMAALGAMGLMPGPQGLTGSYMGMMGAEALQGGGARRPRWALDEDDEILGRFDMLDRDFGPYAGPRGRRDADQLTGGLSALTARRRARAAMFSGRQTGREQPERQRGLVGGTDGLRRRGVTGAGVGAGSRGVAAAAAGGAGAARVGGGGGGLGRVPRGVLFDDSIVESGEEDDQQEEEYKEEEYSGLPGELASSSSTAVGAVVDDRSQDLAADSTLQQRGDAVQQPEAQQQVPHAEQFLSQPQPSNG